MSLARKSVIGGLWMAGVSNISFAINFLGQIILARLLFPEDFGIFALAMSISNILFMLGGFGLAMACISLQDEPDVFDTTMVFSWVLAGVLALLGIGVSFGASFFYDRKIVVFLLILCVIKALQFPASIYSAWMEKSFLFRRIAVVSGITRNSAVFIAVILAYTGLGPWSLLAREVLAILFLFAGMGYYSSYKFHLRFNKQTAFKIWRYVYKMFFMRMSETVFFDLPNFLLGTICGTNILGLFERSLYLTRLPNFAVAPFTAKVGFALYSRVKHDDQKTAEGLYWSTLAIIRIMLPLSIIAFLFPEMILKLLFGAKWTEAAPFLRGLAILLAATPVFEIIKHAMLARKYIRDVTVARTVGIAIFLVGTGIASLEHSWHIIPWSMSVGIVVATLLLARRVYSTGIRIGWVKILALPIVLGVFISCLGLYLKYQSVNTILNVAFMLILWIIGILSLEYKQLIALYHRVRE